MILSLKLARWFWIRFPHTVKVTRQAEYFWETGPKISFWQSVIERRQGEARRRKNEEARGGGAREGGRGISVCPWDGSPPLPLGPCYFPTRPLYCGSPHTLTHFQTISVPPQDACRYRPAATSPKLSMLSSALAEGIWRLALVLRPSFHPFFL